MATKLEGGGKALVGGPIKKCLLFAASLSRVYNSVPAKCTCMSRKRVQMNGSQARLYVNNNVNTYCKKKKNAICISFIFVSQ